MAYPDDYTVCEYWRIRADGMSPGGRGAWKCGKCDACMDQGDQKYHELKDEGRI